MPEKEQKKLSPEVAEGLLPHGELIRTLREGKPITIWPREAILERFKTHGVELSGLEARKRNFGLCSFDNTNGFLFIETRVEKKPDGIS